MTQHTYAISTRGCLLLTTHNVTCGLPAKWRGIEVQPSDDLLTCPLSSFPRRCDTRPCSEQLDRSHTRMEEDVVYTGKEEAVMGGTAHFPSFSPSSALPFSLPFSPTSLSLPLSSLDAELFFLLCSLLRFYGLHDIARTLWQQRRAIGDLSSPSDPSELPLSPLPAIPDDALRLLMLTLLQRQVPPPDGTGLPPSLLHSGRQALLPHFRSHPLRLVVQSTSLTPPPRHSLPTFPHLRARSFLPSPLHVSPSSLRALSATSLSLAYRPLKFLLGHLAPVYSVIFDSSGLLCATASDDRLVKVWSAVSGRLLMTLRGHEKEVTDIAISPDNELLASASWDHSIRVWQLRKGGEVYAVFFHHHSNKIWRIAFHPLYTPQHRLLFSASMDGSTQIFDLNRPEAPSIRLVAHPQHLHMADHLTAWTEEEAIKGQYQRWLTAELHDANHGMNGAPARAPTLPFNGEAAVQAAAAAAVSADVIASGIGGAGGVGGGPSSSEMLCISHHPSGEEFALGSNDRCIRVYSQKDQRLVALLKGAQGEIDQLHYDHTGESEDITPPQCTHFPPLCSTTVC